MDENGMMHSSKNILEKNVLKFKLFRDILAAGNCPNCVANLGIMLVLVL